MGVTLIEEGSGCQLLFAGALTFEYAMEIEDRIIDALRRFSSFEVDLSAVTEIDLCGIHLLGVLHHLGGDRVKVLASSPVVDQASRRLLASSQAARLYGNAKREQALRGG